MDQSAFRSLLSAPRPTSSSQSKPGPSRNILGAPAPKRGGWGIKAKPGHEYKPKDETPKEETPAFVPRTQYKRPSDGKYKDRAEMRRAGVDDEYKPVEKLLEDFEKRKVEAGEDADKVEKTRAYLGGDATHSILVKGLDYALLAARKAELEREGEEVADDELDALLQDGRRGAKAEKGKEGKNGEREVKGEELNSRFKSIAQRQAEAETASGEKKKKKKKKKVKQEPGLGSKAETASTLLPQPDATAPVLPVKADLPSLPPPSSPVEEDLGEDGNIFDDVGEYDLNTGHGESEDDSDREVAGKKDVEMGLANGKGGRRRSRSNASSQSYRSRSRAYTGTRQSRYRSRSRSYSEDRYRAPRRSRSPYHERDRYLSYSRSRSPPRYRDDMYSRRSRSPHKRRRLYSRSLSPYHRRQRSYTRSRSRSPVRQRRASRSPPRKRQYSRSASPHRRSPSPSPPRRFRSRSRSPTPILAAQPLPFSRFPSPSSGSSDEAGPARRIGRLQPLQSSAIADLSSFLAADAESAKAEEKRLRKAKWRAAQGLGVQEGVDPDSLKRKEVSEKGKANREYQMVMNKVNKEKQ